MTHLQTVESFLDGDGPRSVCGDADPGDLFCFGTIRADCKKCLDVMVCCNANWLVHKSVNILTEEDGHQYAVRAE